jgi:hypothetical protein
MRSCAASFLLWRIGATVLRYILSTLADRRDGAALHPWSGAAVLACILLLRRLMGRAVRGRRVLFAGGDWGTSCREASTRSSGGGLTPRSLLVEIRKGDGRPLHRASGKRSGDLEGARQARGMRDG